LVPDETAIGDRIMKALLVAAALTMAGTSAALAQVYVYGAPYYGGPSVVYGYAPGSVGTYGYYGYAPGGWYGYGAFDESGNSYRQPSPRSTIRAVR
jgi:hypothetical protein